MSRNLCFDVFGASKVDSAGLYTFSTYAIGLSLHYELLI